MCILRLFKGGRRWGRDYNRVQDLYLHTPRNADMVAVWQAYSSAIESTTHLWWRCGRLNRPLEATTPADA